MKKFSRRTAIAALSAGSLFLVGMGSAAAMFPSVGGLLENVNVSVGGRNINLAPVGSLIDNTISGGGSFLGNLGDTARGILIDQNPCVAIPVAGNSTRVCPFTDERLSGLLGPLGFPDTAAVGNIALEILEREMSAAPADRRSGGAFGINPSHLALIEGREERREITQALINSRLDGDGQERILAEEAQFAQITANNLEASAVAQGQVITQEVLKQISAQLGQGAIADYRIYNQLVDNGSTAFLTMGVQNDIRAHLDAQEERRIMQTGTALTQNFNDYAAFAAALPQ